MSSKITRSCFMTNPGSFNSNYNSLFYLNYAKEKLCQNIIFLNQNPEKVSDIKYSPLKVMDKRQFSTHLYFNRLTRFFFVSTNKKYWTENGFVRISLDENPLYHDENIQQVKRKINILAKSRVKCGEYKVLILKKIVLK